MDYYLLIFWKAKYKTIKSVYKLCLYVYFIAYYRIIMVTHKSKL